MWEWPEIKEVLVKGMDENLGTVGVGGLVVCGMGILGVGVGILM